MNEMLSCQLPSMDPECNEPASSSPKSDQEPSSPSAGEGTPSSNGNAKDNETPVTAAESVAVGTGPPQPSEAGSAGDDDREEEDETDEEEERRQFGIYKCLPVDDREPDFESGEPDSAEEYLRRVRWEASHLPRVVVSSVDPRTFDACRTAYPAAAVAASDLPDCPPQLQPSPAWVRQFLSSFALLRQQLQREYEADSGQVAGLPLRLALRTLATPHPVPQGGSHGEGAEAQQPSASATGAGAAPASACTPPDPFLLHSSSSPSPSLLMPELLHLRGLDQVQIVQRAAAHLKRVTRGEGLTPQDAAWLYAYSARIEEPLHADTCALYRGLLRHCAHLRARTHDPHDPLLPHLNILIALAGGHFRQDPRLATLRQGEEEWAEDFTPGGWEGVGEAELEGICL